jgi:hypothetical protein
MSTIADARILQLAEPFLQQPDAKVPTIRGDDDLLGFARAVLAADQKDGEPWWRGIPLPNCRCVHPLHGNRAPAFVIDDPVADAARTMPLGPQRTTAEIGESLARYANAEVITDPVAIEEAFERDDALPAASDLEWAGRAMNDGRDEQCDAWAGFPFGVLDELGLLKKP